ncbi:MAG: hypothetical protein V7638_276 [Acidobacteriota bacterium]|jgi:hypothetical protein
MELLEREHFLVELEAIHNDVASGNGCFVLVSGEAGVGKTSPLRCPSASQFIASPTPNDNPEADAMVSTIAHVLNAIVTNPLGDAWFDRYGLENADKCAGTYGQTFLTANGARANVRTAYGDFLIQQNWVNSRKPRCALSQ